MADWYAGLTPETLSRLDEFYHASARFKDPFNTVNSREGIRQIFEHMFAKLDQPTFVVQEQLLDGRQAFLVWQFQFSLRGRRYSLQGGSHLRFDELGYVTEHRDYWDSAEELLHKLPLIGPPLRAVRRLLSVRDDARHS